MISSFSGEYGFLSNFSQYPVAGFPTNEHFFHAHKTSNLAEQSRFKNPRMTAGEAKRAGRKIDMTKAEIESWNDRREHVMAQGISFKFSIGSSLAQKLLQTGDEELIEGNTWHDNIWGNCICANCANIEGQNLLGKILMTQRTFLRTQLIVDDVMSPIS